MVADHRMPTGKAASSGGVVQGAEQGAGGCDLDVAPALETRGGPAGQIAEDITAGLVDAEVARGTGEALPLQMAEQLCHERGRRGRRPPDGVTGPDHTGGDPPAGQRLLVLHDLMLPAAWWPSHRCARVSSVDGAFPGDPNAMAGVLITLP